MKRIVLYLLAVGLFLSLFGQEPSKATISQYIDYSVGFSQNTSEKVLYSNLSSTLEVFGEFKVETEDDDHSHFGHRLSSKLALPLAHVDKRKYSFFRDTKPTKLYILFHSWKSFLPI